MQTFLPYPNFLDSALVLDRQRLGKQRVEAKQIINTLEGTSSGWANHPAVKMWRGYEQALALYGVTVCAVWIERGYKDTLLPFFALRLGTDDMPPWMGDPLLHLSHQSNLLRKDPEYYGQFFDITPDLPYVWPQTVAV